MANPLNYAEIYQQTLQQAYGTQLYFNDLWNSPMNSQVQFVDAKTVKLPRLTILNGRKPYDRDTVTTPSRNYENDFEIKELKFDRYWDTLVDPVNIDETNLAVSIANITNQYNRDQKIPEKDKYMVSKLYAEKLRVDNGATNISEELTKDNILDVFDTLMTQMDEAEVPMEGRFLYITPTVNKILKNAQEIQRFISVQGGTTGAIDRAVHSLDDVNIKVVPSARMKTVYNFTTGVSDDPTALQIQMFIIHQECMAAPEKYSFVGLDEPSAKTSGKYFYFERSYSDVFLFDKKAPGISFVTKPAGSGS
jgi:hypothetical protein